MKDKKVVSRLCLDRCFIVYSKYTVIVYSSLKSRSLVSQNPLIFNMHCSVPVRRGILDPLNPHRRNVVCIKNPCILWSLN